MSEQDNENEMSEFARMLSDFKDKRALPKVRQKSERIFWLPVAHFWMTAWIALRCSATRD